MKNKLPIPPNGSRQQFLTRAINYFRSREGEPRLFTKRKLVLLVLTALYAFSPIDLIPDFILNRDFKRTIILVTHEEDIAKYAARIIRIVDGKIHSDEKATAKKGDADD